MATKCRGRLARIGVGLLTVSLVACKADGDAGSGAGGSGGADGGANSGGSAGGGATGGSAGGSGGATGGTGGMLGITPGGGMGGCPNADPLCALACSCDDGRTGTPVCSDCEYQGCDCSSCPSFTVAEPPAFTPCGGEPFGTWQLTSYETAGLDFAGCEAAEVALDGDPEMRLDLPSGGNADVFVRNVPIEFKVMGACLRSALGEGCASVDVTGGACTESCGICTCTTLVPPLEVRGTWSRTGQSLVLPELGVFEYCVADDTLQLVQPGGFLATLKRVYPFWRPDRCVDRPAASCDFDDGCTRGACVGGNDCGAVTNAGACGAIQGCAWDTAQCSGSSPSRCRLKDFGSVPGCEFLPGEMQCAGERTPCSALPEGECSGICRLTTGCAGTIYCNEDTDCVGPDTPCAEEAADRTSCETLALDTDNDCQWLDNACTGDATPCDELAVEECADYPGCALEEL